MLFLTVDRKKRQSARDLGVDGRQLHVAAAARTAARRRGATVAAMLRPTSAASRTLTIALSGETAVASAPDVLQAKRNRSLIDRSDATSSAQTRPRFGQLHHERQGDERGQPSHEDVDRGAQDRDRPAPGIADHRASSWSINWVHAQPCMGQALGREVADVVGHDEVGVSGECRGDDVPVARIDFLWDRSDEAFRPVRHRLGECRLHPLAAPLEPLGMFRLALGQTVDELGEDLAAPRRATETAFSEPQQQVADYPRVQDARVEQCDVGHAALLVVDAELLRPARHVGEHRRSLLAPYSDVDRS